MDGAATVTATTLMAAAATLAVDVAAAVADAERAAGDDAANDEVPPPPAVNPKAALRRSEAMVAQTLQGAKARYSRADEARYNRADEAEESERASFGVDRTGLDLLAATSASLSRLAAAKRARGYQRDADRFHRDDAAAEDARDEDRERRRKRPQVAEEEVEDEGAWGEEEAGGSGLEEADEDAWGEGGAKDGGGEEEDTEGGTVCSRISSYSGMLRSAMVRLKAMGRRAIGFPR